MRTPTPPSPTIMALLDPFRNLFSETDLERFVDHETCLMTAERPACITDVQRTARDERHYSRHRDLLAHSELCPRAVLAQACRHTGLLARATRLSHGRDVLVCVGDDTTRRRALSPKLFGAAFHHDHAASHGQTPKCWGQNLVLLGVIPDPLGPGRARAHLSDFELWVPSKRSEEAGCETLPYETKAALLELMLDRQRAEIGPEPERLVLVDSLYAKAPLLNAARRDPRTHILGRLASNRVAFEPPPPREPGRRGAPRRYGERIEWKQEFAAHARAVELRLYGRAVEARLWAVTGRVRLHHADVRLVVSQLEGAKNPSLFLCTDLTLSDTEIPELYGARFSIEGAIRDQVCELALGAERSQVVAVYQMQVALKLVAGLLLEHLSERQPHEVRERVRDRWRKKRARLSLGQVRRGLRFECWSGREVFRRDGLWSEPPPNSARIEMGAAA